MTRRELSRFLLGGIIAATVVHVATSVVAVWGLYVLYPHRIYDVRRWSDDAAASFRLVGTYLAENAVRRDRPLIVFAGSSVTFGHQFHESVIFTRLFADRHATAAVLNVSIIAADVSAVNDWIVCAARRNGIRFDTLVIELPVVNSLSYLVNVHHAGHQPSPLSTCDHIDRDPGYMRFALSAFRGTGWVGFVRPSQELLGGDAPIRIERVPRGYFASALDFAAVREQFSDQIVSTLQKAQTVATVVYAFPSPVFVGGLAQIDEDDQAVRAQLKAALDACRSVSGIDCIDPSPLYVEPGYYSNLTHFNRAGHKAMADLLEASVAVR